MSVIRLLPVILLCTALLPAANQLVDREFSLTTNNGEYCDNGSYFLLTPSPDDPQKLKIWGTFCHSPDRPNSFAQTSTFLAPPYFRIYTIGWAKSPTFSLERTSDGRKFHLVPFDENQQRWSRSDYALPADWRGKEVRIVAEGAPQPGLWRAFSEPVVLNGSPAAGDALNILGLTALHGFALMVCALAVTALAILRGLRDRIQAGLLTLAATAIPGYCVFWLTLATPRLNRYYALLFLIAALIGFFSCCLKLDHAGRALLRSLSTPILLTGANALMVLSSGFLFGGMHDSLSKAQCRFLPRLPPDNELPLLLAMGTRSPHVPVPMQGNWLSSDRPPLQSGIVLAHFPLFRKPREQGYTVISVLAQSLWIFGMWLLLTAFKLNKRSIALALAACLFSGFAFLNTFFVWPKLLAAAYCLGFLAAFVAGSAQQNSRFLPYVVPAALLSFSLLAHGGTVFAIVPAVVLTLLWKRPCPVKRMAVVSLLGFLIYSPWLLYQKLYDPPGDRLLKYHLAGVEQVDPRPFSEAVETAYKSLSWSQIADYKRQNFEFAFGEGLPSLEATTLLLKSLLTPGALPDAAERGFNLREQIFFHPAACLGLFLFAPCALLAGIWKRFRTSEWRAAVLFWLFTFVSMAFWCLAMFGPSSTSIHQGAYATMLLAFVASVLSYWAISPVLTLIITLFQILLNFTLNECLIRVPYPNGLMPEGLLHTDTFVLLSVSVLAVLWLLKKVAQDSR